MFEAMCQIVLFPHELLLCTYTTLLATLPEPDDPIIMKLCGIWGSVPLLIYDFAREFIRAENLTFIRNKLRRSNGFHGMPLFSSSEHVDKRTEV